MLRMPMTVQRTNTSLQVHVREETILTDQLEKLLLAAPGAACCSLRRCAKYERTSRRGTLCTRHTSSTTTLSGQAVRAKMASSVCLAWPPRRFPPLELQSCGAPGSKGVLVPAAQVPQGRSAGLQNAASAEGRHFWSWGLGAG